MTALGEKALFKNIPIACANEGILCVALTCSFKLASSWDRYYYGTAQVIWHCTGRGSLRCALSYFSELNFGGKIFSWSHSASTVSIREMTLPLLYLFRTKGGSFNKVGFTTVLLFSWCIRYPPAIRFEKSCGKWRLLQVCLFTSIGWRCQGRILLIALRYLYCDGCTTGQLTY